MSGQKMEAAGEEEDLKRYFNILELSLVKVIYSPRPGRHWLLQTEAGAELSSMVLAAASMILALNSPSLPEHTQIKSVPKNCPDPIDAEEDGRAVSFGFLGGSDTCN
ncbi:predicted protein [Histoplasma capsulatum H143]|uniref:Uncharacterized protein n=1 Tax=Ajellomyces capsulatus (strain H143) TaxID=544712 RepID=C6H9I5_AJECH|nr:predicted protein [Histoplasma capsulatum H143]